ncbi:hypothetical protein M378DRAFT_162568 [Amanita muscaria Koide BX008]|uniref:Secreted protein n=1 Tax=Amanita muscaria (strain Koide BX008) TaxID=946122 RepID=A0A0C2X6W5_AMAMK|nr:hypothetical protein M378DRAFT_162568 [Amanita muscaria Koide BX008]
MIPTMLPFLLYTFLSVFTFVAKLGTAFSTGQCDSAYQNISAISPMASVFAPLNSFPRQVLVARQTTCSVGPLFAY